MLISRVPEEAAGRGEPAGDIARNCQTASELFDLMTKDHDFEAGDDPLSSSDLVLLYKNIDLGNQLMSNVRTNQYVENVYHDDPETDSDLSESCSSEELRNIILVNKERIDFLTNQPSFNSLNHKLGDLEIQVSNFSTGLYDDRHFLYKDPYIKEQLQNLQLMFKANELDTNLLPTSLLDYICGRRLEDNYNFYLDNVITYVTHTIDQLKRISNGDYLPQKVKEKWRESDKRFDESSKVLNTSISMPLQRKTTRPTSSWDDIVHTEVDLRSLVKMLEKKVVIDVPRMICGSYKFFSKLGADKLVISCEREEREAGAQAEPRVGVVLRVRSAADGQLSSNIDSIMLPRLELQICHKDCKEVLPLEYQNAASSPRIIEISDMDEKSDDKCSVKSDECGSLCSISDDRDGDYMKDECLNAANRPESPEAVAQILSTAARVVCAEAVSNHATPNDLHISMINLDRQAFSAEESTLGSYHVKAKKKSPERPRVKSPYENKSYVLEEKKRRKLLEVRERRERRKKASNENSKVSKHKAFPQSVSSVTKLSITNRAFYDSIYGRNTNGENANRITAPALNKGRKGTQKVDGVIKETDLESEADADERGDALPDKSIKKICTHFLDDTETEMSYLQSKEDSDFLRVSTSTSVVSNESATNLCTPTGYCSSHASFNVKKQESSTSLGKRRLEHEVEILETIKAQDAILKNPANSPQGDCDKAPAVECRRSLEKIYTLMQKLHQIETTETSKKKATVNDSRTIGSESGTNLKRRVSFSNPRFEIHPDGIRRERDDDLHVAGVPKVVISAKPKTGKSEDKNERKSRTPRVKTIPENPLKAISQLLQEFDNVQKTRPKIADPKSINRSIFTENTEQPIKIPKRRPRIESPVKDDPPKIGAKVKTRFGREERIEVKSPVVDKKITDLIDEVKEARGEAVRGPPRFSSRLNALAQPKRAYVQAVGDAFPSHRRQTPERTARLTSRRRVPDAHVSPTSTRAPNSSLERAAKPRSPAAGSPERGHRASPNIISVAEATNTLDPLNPPQPAAPVRLAPARAPLLPSDLQLTSQNSSQGTDDDVPQSRSIGIKLHRMVRAMLHNEWPAAMDADTDTSLGPSPPSEDPLKTQAVSSIEVEKTVTSDENKPSDVEVNDARHTPSPVNSVTELEMLHALHRSLSLGAFAGRLRVNKLTLSPRPSLQQVVTHQSGDTTLVLKSSLHQKIRVTCQSSDHTTDLMGLLSTTGLNCGFSEFPLQISTVGFAFPTFQCGLKKYTPRIVCTGRSAASDAGTLYEINESPPAAILLQIKDDKKEEACQCATGVSEPAETVTKVCAPKINVETATKQESAVIVSPSIACSRDEEITSYADQENHLPSDYTASFDILVGLLNEIQKITSCGCDAASSETVSEPCDFSPRENPARAQASGEKEKDGKTDCVSLYVSSSDASSDGRTGISVPETKSVTAEATECKPVCEDKEILARVEQLQATASTSQETGLFPDDTATPATCIATTSCSGTALAVHCEIGSNTSIRTDHKITEQTVIETNRASVKSLVPYYNNIFKVETRKEERSSENSVSFATLRDASASCNILTKIPLQKSKRVSKKREQVEIPNSKTEVKEFCLHTADWDCTLRVKRDILVTLYSILVLTVFAALAFPEMLQLA